MSGAEYNRVERIRLDSQGSYSFELSIFHDFP